MAEHKMYVYGHSDDLIEVEGDVTEELYANFNGPTHVFVGDTEIVAEYDGEWHFDVVDKGRNDTTHWYSVGRRKVIEELNDYTECIVVESTTDTVAKVGE